MPFFVKQKTKVRIIVSILWNLEVNKENRIDIPIRKEIMVNNKYLKDLMSFKIKVVPSY